MINDSNDNSFISLSNEDFFFSHSSQKGEQSFFDEDLFLDHAVIKEPSSNYTHHHDCTDIDDFIASYQSEIKILYYESNFKQIQSLLEHNFPHFFELSNYSFLYYIQKLRFFKLLQQNNSVDVDFFYYNDFFPILKEAKPKEWRVKHKLFIQLMKTPSFLMKQGDLLNKYYDQFQYELDKSIRLYLTADLTKDIKKTSLIEEGIASDIYIQENNTPIKNDISDLSTKEEFSDFEDELENKQCNGDNDNDNNCGNLNQSCHQEEDIIVFSKAPNNNNNHSTNEISNRKPSECLIQSTPTNYSRIQNPKDSIKGNNLHKLLPFLACFKPSYAKRETLDKKIIRLFRQYIVSLNQKQLFDPNKQKDTNFWILFVNGNLFPPINYYNNNTEERITFKSLNANYLLWLFSRNGVKEMYESFIKYENCYYINTIINSYSLNQKEKEKLHSYIINLPFIFDISLINSNYFPSKNNNRPNRRIETNNKDRSREYSKSPDRQLSSEDEE